jgi:hypothetical protein
MARNPWVHGTWRRRRPAREADVCGVGSMRWSHDARRGEAEGARRAHTRHGMSTEMAQVWGGAR